MICDLCNKNKAEIFIEEESLYRKKRYSICKECARAFNITSSKTSENSKNINKLFASIEKEKEKRDPDTKKNCSVCGKTLFEIKKYLVVGCAECYSCFKEEISDLLNNEKILVNYQGTYPEILKESKSTLLTRFEIQNKLEESVRTEDYEKAAVYRDYLLDLDKKTVNDDAVKEAF